LAASDGGVFSFGGLHFYGSMGSVKLNKPVVGIAATPDGGGYWLVAADGGIFSFGDARFFGSMGNVRLNEPVVGMATTPDGGGYWMVASDGGIFSFGDARFFGSMGNVALAKPVVGMASTPNGHGYWMVASDGGIFTFGDAPFQGSLGADPLTFPEVAMSSTGVPNEIGYWMVNSNGAVSSFGPAGNFGSAPQHINAPVVGMADGPGNGAVTNTQYSSGSFGYDVSSFQCNTPLPSGHTIGVVEATGWSMSAPNPCISQEANWAGGGLNLYIFLTYGTDNTNQPGCAGDQACNFGFEAARYAFDYAQSQSVSPYVGWWLDIECTANCSDWSSSAAENDQVVNGALIELRGLGINTVGIYTSPLTWNNIAGNYQPAVPLWIAWWTGDPQGNCSNAYSYAQSNGNDLPTGGVMITQFTDNQGGFDGDYAC
jgi:hypothetical protein